jgi:hypothetical protein
MKSDPDPKALTGLIVLWPFGGISVASSVKENVTKLAKDVDDVCRWVRTAHFISAGVWDITAIILGVSAIVVGVFGGGSAGAGVFGAANPGLAGVYSAIAGVTAGVVAFLKPSDRAVLHKKAGDDWSNLRDKVASFWQLQVALETDEHKLVESYNALLKEKEDITTKSPVLSNLVFARAKQVLKKRDEEEAKEAVKKRKEEPGEAPI